MAKVTFRADDDLVDRVEELDTSKSEVMREALRAYLDREGGTADGPDRTDSLDDVVADRVNELVERRLRERRPERPRDVNVNISLDRRASETDDDAESGERADAASVDPADRRSCTQCGESLDPDHVYCPNCGEQAASQAFCDCGEELRADWAYCPACGRRTPSADVLDR
ncbi:MAG: zinc ribbon domain-containing protein [Halobacteriaceae archaeon]